MRYKRKLQQWVNCFLSVFGLRVERFYGKGWLKKRITPDKNMKLYVGAGPDKKEGYIHNDIRPLPNIDLICKAWEISNYVIDAEIIFSRHTLEHLSDEEARLTLLDWRKALKRGGEVKIIVPDMDFHINQWINCNWEMESEAKNTNSLERWAFAGFYGWQRECNPQETEYNTSYWDVHKSGYNKARMGYLLNRAGYNQVEVKTVDSCHLVATAIK